MRVAHQPLRDGKRLELVDGRIERASVARHFIDVGVPFRGRVWPSGAGFVFEHLAQRRLSALDAARQHRFVRRQRREEHVGIRNALEDSGVSRNGGVRGTDERDELIPVQRLRRKRPFRIGVDHLHLATLPSYCSREFITTSESPRIIRFTLRSRCSYARGGSAIGRRPV
jgi:hypothetical protein